MGRGSLRFINSEAVYKKIKQQQQQQQQQHANCSYPYLGSYGIYS